MANLSTCSDDTTLSVSLNKADTMCLSSREDSKDRRSPHISSNASLRHGTVMLSSRVDWDPREDDVSDDCMSEDDYDDRQPNDRDSGKALDDDEGAELSDWEALPRDRERTSRSTPHSVSYIGRLPIPRDEDHPAMASSSSSAQLRQPAFPGNREIMGGSRAQADDHARITQNKYTGAEAPLHSAHSYRYRVRSPGAQRTEYEADRAGNLNYRPRSPQQQRWEPVCGLSKHSRHHATPYRAAYEQRSPRLPPITTAARTSIPDLVSKFASFAPVVQQPKSNSPSPATSLSTLPPTPPAQYSRMPPHGYARHESYPPEHPRWHHRGRSPIRGVPMVAYDELDELEPQSPRSSISPSSSFASLTSTPNRDVVSLPSVDAPRAPRDKNAWKEHCEIENGPNGETLYHCMWTPPGGKPCDYTAKRHLVKRHVETRHLQIKDHICPYCDKPFPQRVSLRIHVDSKHTGAKPHECKYNCGKSFSDPARRHKHMVEVHGYNPQGPRKRSKATMDSSNSRFETLPPWTAEAAAANRAL